MLALYLQHALSLPTPRSVHAPSGTSTCPHTPSPPFARRRRTLVSGQCQKTQGEKNPVQRPAEKYRLPFVTLLSARPPPAAHLAHTPAKAIAHAPSRYKYSYCYYYCTGSFAFLFLLCPALQPHSTVVLLLFHLTHLAVRWPRCPTPRLLTLLRRIPIRPSIAFITSRNYSPPRPPPRPPRGLRSSAHPNDSPTSTLAALTTPRLPRPPRSLE